MDCKITFFGNCFEYILEGSRGIICRQFAYLKSSNSKQNPLLFSCGISFHNKICIFKTATWRHAFKKRDISRIVLKCVNLNPGLGCHPDPWRHRSSPHIEVIGGFSILVGFAWAAWSCYRETSRHGGLGFGGNLGFLGNGSKCCIKCGSGGRNTCFLNKHGKFEMDIPLSCNIFRYRT